MRLLQAARESRSHDGSTCVDKQDAKVTAYAAAFEHDIVAVAADKGVSGSTDPFERKGLGPWLTDPALIASYDGIIASHLDRLGRSTRYIGRLLEWAADHGKVVICVEPAVDFSTPVGKLIAFIISWLAEQELALITARSADTQKMLRDGGFLVGRPPYGFMVTGKGEHKTMAPHPAEAEFVRQAVRRYLDGDSLRTVCQWLDGQGSTPRQHRESKPVTWSPVSLSQVFRNESLIGRRVDASGRTVLRHDPVLDRETWDQLQAMLDGKARRKGIAPKQTAMLTSVATCGRCGGAMYRVDSGNRRADGTKTVRLYYRCHGTDRAPSACKLMVPLAQLEGWTDARMAANTSYVIETVTVPGSGHEDAIAEVERDLRELDWDAADFTARQAALMTERKRLKGLPATPARTEERVASYTVGDLWQMLAPADRRRYLLECGVKVIVSDRDPSGWRIDGDPSSVARGGWSELVTTAA